MWDGVIVGTGLSALGGFVLIESGDRHQAVAGGGLLAVGMLLLVISVRLLRRGRRR
ncbi:MAG: hypothetical protein JWQ90_3285 [Hydrocarboniphaga sp.]|uniref:hypothetical protein n=1 Tax=Hydrocarboniphaga sp. TaxID=2033016 RepID=UPI002626DAE1|nr:hypothetical protein [Hydrocarboniphaga sp.]MDB5970835.1 hypothetical protein [Hydrocarboniphaga sp.]